MKWTKRNYVIKQPFPKYLKKTGGKKIGCFFLYVNYWHSSLRYSQDLGVASPHPQHEVEIELIYCDDKGQDSSK